MKKKNKHLLKVMDLGARDYDSCLELQRNLVDQRKNGEIPDTLILVEHDRVYTMGRNAREGNVIATKKELEHRGIRVVKTDRGGDVTYHGPGQLVGYPIINISGEDKGVLWYVQGLEEVLCRTLRTFGLEPGTDPHNRGVWLGNDKIAAIGVRVTRHVTMHGFALNVSVNIDDYRGIIPCGIVGKGITSLHRLVPDVSMAEVKKRLIQRFVKVFGYEEVIGA